jgi:hypothetical protein
MLPITEDDELMRRAIPTLPYVFLKDTAKYWIYGDVIANKYYMTMTGRIDNNQGESIVIGTSDRVARGFFWKDVTYGIENIDGFVVYYKSIEREWAWKSLDF